MFMNQTPKKMLEEQKNGKSPSDGDANEKTALERLQDWYAQQLNGDWEHGRGICIKSLDNPGWMLDVDLQGIDRDFPPIPYVLNEQHEGNWYSFSLENQYFRGAGDPSKLPFLIEAFLKAVGEQ